MTDRDRGVVVRGVVVRGGPMSAWEGTTRDMTRAELAHWQDQANTVVQYNAGLTRFDLTVRLEERARAMRSIGTPAPARGEWGAIQRALDAALGLPSYADRLMAQMEAQGIVKRETTGTGKALTNLSKRRG